MLKTGLLHELLHEAQNTKKLIAAIPDNLLNWKLTEKSMTTAELASHIVGLYDWYERVIQHSELDFHKYDYKTGDTSKTENILAKLDENIKNAKAAIDNFDDVKALEKWRLVAGAVELVPPMPKVAVLRSIVCNHIYHHRGQLTMYLRVSGNKVPGLYGPSADEKG